MMRNWLDKRALVAVFVLCALPVCLSTALITPPGQSPDEPAHIARAEGLLRGVVFGRVLPYVDPQTLQTQMLGGLRAAPDIFIDAFGVDTVVPGRPTPLFTSANMAQMETKPRDLKLFSITIPNTIAYFPAAYVPAAIGIAVGRAIRASPYQCIMFARLSAALAFVGLGGLTLWLSAYGEAVLMVVLLAPMTLFLAATENQDGMLVAMVCLACALLTRGSRLAGLVVMALVLGAKPPYFLMLGVFLLPLAGPDLWRKLRDAAIALTPVVVWVVLVALFVSTPIPRPLYHPGPLFAGDHSIWMDRTASAINLRILLGRPSLLLTLPIQMFTQSGQFLLLGREMIGLLANLSIGLPNGLYIAWTVAFACALVGLLATRRPSAKLVDCGFVWVLLAGTIWIVTISFYLVWTGAGLDHIEGLQGRYLLLLLPFLIFAVPSWQGGWRLPPLLPALPAVALGLYDLGYLPYKLALSFYLN